MADPHITPNDARIRTETGAAEMQSVAEVLAFPVLRQSREVVAAASPTAYADRMWRPSPGDQPADLSNLRGRALLGHTGQWRSDGEAIGAAELRVRSRMDCIDAFGQNLPLAR